MTEDARSTDRPREQGVALVELALVLLPLCLVVFGAIDVGRAFITLDQLRNEAQAGAFFARGAPTAVSQDSSALCTDPNNIQYQVANEVNAGGPAGSSSLPTGQTLTVKDLTTGATMSGCGPNSSWVLDSSATCPSSRGSSSMVVCSGDTIQVSVSWPFHLVTPLIGQIVGNNVTLTGTSKVVVS